MTVYWDEMIFFTFWYEVKRYRWSKKSRNDN